MSAVKTLSEEFYKLKDELKELEPLKNKVLELEKKSNSDSETMKTQLTVIRALEQKVGGLQKMVIGNDNEGLSVLKGKADKIQNKFKNSDVSFENKDEWKKHRNEKHQKIMNCKTCELTFYLCIDLEVHLKTHGKPKDFECDICDQEFYLN